MTKIQKYLTYLKENISIIEFIHTNPCSNRLPVFQTSKLELRAKMKIFGLQEDWNKQFNLEDLTNIRQDFKDNFNAVSKLRNIVNDRKAKKTTDTIQHENWEMELVL